MHPAAVLSSIPHLVDLICDDLTTRDIYRSTLVCRDFYLGFSRNIFRSINIQRRATFNKLVRQDTLKALASLTRNIYSIETIYTEICCILIHAVLPYPCPVPTPTIDPTKFLRLRSLRFEYPSYVKETKLLKNHEFLSFALSVIEASPNLESLYFGFFVFKNPDYIQQLLSAIRKKGRRFHELHFCSTESVGIRILRQLLWSCASVHKLILDIKYDDYAFIEISASEEEMLLNSAREALFIDAIHTQDLVFQWKQLYWPSITYRSYVAALLPVFRYCSLLEEIRVPISTLYHFSPSLLPNLRHVNLSYLNPLRSYNYDNYDDYPYVSRILKILGPLQTLVMNSKIQSEESPLIRDLLISKSCTMLENLEISGSNIQSKDMQLILCSCPGLRKFEASQAYSRDTILDLYDLIDTNGNINYGWACLGLEVLRLHFRYYSCGGIPDVLCEQISRLTKLQILDLTNTKDTTYYERSLYSKGGRDSVREALEKWSVLTDLKQLTLKGIYLVLNKEEMKSVIKPWRNLRWIDSHI